MANPRRRRHSAAVYRRRRLVVLLSALLIALGIWALIAQPLARAAENQAESEVSELVAETPTPSPSPSRDLIEELKAAGTAPAPTSSAAPSPSSAEPEVPEASSQASGGPQPCQVNDIRVEALTNQDSYAAGQLPELSLRVTNTGTVSCVLDVGTRSQKFTITSGRDTWWRSADCQAEPTNSEVILEAGRSAASAAPVV